MKIAWTICLAFAAGFMYGLLTANAIVAYASLAGYTLIAVIILIIDGRQKRRRRT